MFRLRISPALLAVIVLSALAPQVARAQTAWTFAVSGDSRNCGDFVMPAIAAKVKAEKDAFYWHLGDFRAMSAPDQDLLAMRPGGGQLSIPEYQKLAWSDFLTHQMAPFGTFPVFLGRGNHEDVPPMTRAGYIGTFAKFLKRPEIVAQRKADGGAAGPVEPWYHWTRDGVDFIALDNSSKDEFTAAQLQWLRAVLDRDLATNSGIRTIVAGMHEALPHSTGSSHAMDAWPLGMSTGEQAYGWFSSAQAAGKHVYLIASHSHYYSPNVFNTPFWSQQNKVVPGSIIGLAGAHRYVLPPEADKGSRVDTYGYLQGTVEADGAIGFTLREVSENDLLEAKWPGAPAAAIHECYIHNSDNTAPAK